MGKLGEWINSRVDWSLDSPSKKAGFLIMFVGELALAILLIYVMLFR